MTTVDRFDPFERRISSAIEEIAAAHQPDYLAEALRQTAGTTQRPRWTFTERWLPVGTRRMNRFAILAATTLIAVALVGGTMIITGGPDASPPPTSSPSGTPGTTALPTREAPVPAEAPARGEWLADVGPVPEIGQPAGRIRLSIGWEPSVLVSIIRFDGLHVLHNNSLAAGPGEIRLRATGVAGCQKDEEGRYGFARSSDGMFLTLTLIEDDCATRASVFARTWVRSIGAENDGGRGVADAFSPAILIELPVRRWTAGGEPGSLDLAGDGTLSLVAVKNPAGVSDPCLQRGGEPPLELVAVAPAIEAFSAYLATLPGFTIESEPLEVGGYPAQHLSVTTDAGIDCPGLRVAEFAPNDTLHLYWFVRPGDPDSLWLVQVDEDLYLIRYAGSTAAEEARVISTIEFIDALPTP